MRPIRNFDLDKHVENINRVRKIFDYPARDWVRSRKSTTGTNILDCLIIGGGQSGLGIAFGLIEEKVKNILVIDENKAENEGPWNTFARMPTLRTPKYLTGLDYGNPQLTFRAYFEAKYGIGAFEEIKLIPTVEWAQYLSWYRKVLNIPVQNQTRAQLIRYNTKEKCLEVIYQSAKKESVFLARTVVLANGIDGCGRWSIPDLVKNNLPQSYYLHTRENINFKNFSNQNIGILGAAASAFDNAIMALEAGASSVHLFCRRAPLPQVNPYRWAEFVGFLKHHADLSDKERWRFIYHFVARGQLPPKATFECAMAHQNFYLHIGEHWNKLDMLDKEIRVITNNNKNYFFDFLIVGTGFVTDLSLRPELSLLKEHIALWHHRFEPPKEESNEELAQYPYLGPNFEFQEKKIGEAPYLKSIFCYNFGCFASLGLGGGSISGLKYSLPKVVAGITKQLFCEDADYYLNDLRQYKSHEYELERAPI